MTLTDPSVPSSLTLALATLVKCSLSLTVTVILSTDNDLEVTVSGIVGPFLGACLRVALIMINHVVNQSAAKCGVS